MEVDNNGDLTDEIMQMSTDDINFRSQMLGKYSFINPYDCERKNCFQNIVKIKTMNAKLCDLNGAELHMKWPK